MIDIPFEILELAFELKSDHLTEEQRAICDKWTSGRAVEYMKISLNDPRLFDYVMLYDKLESKKETIWKEIEVLSLFKTRIQQ